MGDNGIQFSNSPSTPSMGFGTSTLGANDSNYKEPEYVQDEVIVKLKADVSFDLEALSTNSPALNRIFRKHKVHKADKALKGRRKDIKNDSRKRRGPLPDLSRIYKIKVPSGKDIQAIIQELRKDPGVEYAEPNYIMQPCATIPNDPLYPQQWALPKIEAHLAWDTEQGDSNIIIAVVDTGIDYNHEDLTAKMWVNEAENLGSAGVDDDGNGYIDDVMGWDFCDNDNDPMDEGTCASVAVGHGTSVAGVAAAESDNSAGISGLNWNSKIMAVRYLGAAGITYAADNGAHVINMSWGSYTYSSFLKDTIDYAYSMGCILVGSAGNDADTALHYPSSYDNVISVGATNSSDQRALWMPSGTNYGPYVDLFAPGDNVYTTNPGNNYISVDGTSLAAPFVSGLASLILSNNSALTNQEVYAIIKRSVADLGTPGWDYYYAWGRINAYQAILNMNATNHPEARIFEPTPNTFFSSGEVEIHGRAECENFDHYIIEWEAGSDPGNWRADSVTLENGFIRIQPC